MVRGCEILAKGSMPEANAEAVYMVPSQTSDKVYTVIRQSWGWTCSCPDHIYRHAVCKHIHSVLFYLRLKEAIYSTDTMVLTPEIVHAVYCKFCQSPSTVRNGFRNTKGGRKPRYFCKVCKREFTFEDEYNGFNRMKHDPNTVTTALDMYFKGASLRSIADHVAQFQGEDLSYSTIYRWIGKYTALINEYAKTLEPQTGERWHADEMEVKTGKEWAWVWNLMDSETKFLLSTVVSRRRSTIEAKELFARGKDQAKGKKPREVVTDGLFSYRHAFLKVFWDHHRSTKHVKGVGFQNRVHNNPIERLHGTMRGRMKVMRGMKGDEKSAQVMMDGFRHYYNFVRPHQSLNGKTPAEASGIKLELGGNKWKGLIERATKLSS